MFEVFSELAFCVVAECLQRNDFFGFHHVGFFLCVRIGIFGVCFDIDWYDDEIYSRLIPLVVNAYNLLTLNKIPEGVEKRWYISSLATASCRTTAFL